MSKHPKNATTFCDAVSPRRGATLCQHPRHDQPDARRLGAAIDEIARNCGPSAKRLLRSGHPRLPAPVIFKISRTHPDRQRFALAQARAGRAALGPPPADVAPAFDTLGPGEVLSRVARNTGALLRDADGLLDTPIDHWPAAEKLAAMLAHDRAIARFAQTMQPSVRDAPTRPECGKARGRTGRRWAEHARKPFDPRASLRTVAAVAGVTKKNARDLARALAEAPPTSVEREALLVGMRALGAAARRHAAVIRCRGHDHSAGPSEVPGTYVVFFRLAHRARLRIGARGVSDFPAGIYAYVGSAFGAGGVQKRTGRHLTRRSNGRWNIDWLKPHCRPVALWWTHDRRKVEFEWAEVFAKLPGASFPSKGFGAGDNKKAQAHLVRFDGVPSLAEFRRRVAAVFADHATVHQVAVAKWVGTGRSK